MSTKIKHTPGPWEARHHDGLTAIACPGGFIIDGCFSEEQDKIDAKLIAAAPELLAFAERVSKGQYGELMGTFISNIRKEANEIIKKATQ